MKNFIILLISVLSLQFAQAQASTIAHETINAQGIEQLKLDLGTKKVEIKKTKGSRIILESKVTISLPNEALLNYLVESGRYGVETSVDASNGALTIARKRNTNVLIVKGQECTEEFSFTIFVPEHIKFIEENNSSASNN